MSQLFPHSLSPARSPYSFILLSRDGMVWGLRDWGFWKRKDQAREKYYKPCARQQQGRKEEGVEFHGVYRPQRARKVREKRLQKESQELENAGEGHGQRARIGQTIRDRFGRCVNCQRTGANVNSGRETGTRTRGSEERGKHIPPRSTFALHSKKPCAMHRAAGQETRNHGSGVLSRFQRAWPLRIGDSGMRTLPKGPKCQDSEQHCPSEARAERKNHVRFWRTCITWDGSLAWDGYSKPSFCFS
ncbi:hypothetical protein B0J18DRAFT_195528 [Chaetomium sp. MPI-SDFR-AT-0129]|nr:hypothetical protein B0J18DRAFT_195528 [Chaetomium sp. MPI-SDFR-AT-0129]